MSRSEHSPVQNALLAALPAADWAQLSPHVELVYLPAGRELFGPDQAVRHVYFPVDSLVALLCMQGNGASDEVSMVGREGVVGVATFMGGTSTPRRAIVECAGHAYRVPKPAIQEAFDRHGALMQVLLRYVLSLLNQIAQTAACNRHHSVEQRLCRLLLLCLDGMPGEQFELTHGLLAEMLGVRRESVSHAAAELRNRGALDYRRGRLTIVDRGVLEALVCECYPGVRTAVDRRSNVCQLRPPAQRVDPGPAGRPSCEPAGRELAGGAPDAEPRYSRRPSG